ncbi:hypothetical protein FB45DRAFT_1005750 [Roridomyces roridus]|uniref:Uncharacterized protein n=1 Tax=Roridomyces roridus TaxID=1738132 RepID=A0AAD7BK28_9AGAR|nr:hypothetical protein FB45DRAFT_1005750 [Roridomyces roridus]
MVPVPFGTSKLALTACRNSLAATGEENEEELKIIKIAGLDVHILPLTHAGGHVLLFRALKNGGGMQLPKSSELDRPRALPPFTSTDEGTPGIDPLRTMKITHRQFGRWAAQTTKDSDPNIDLALQDKSIISLHVATRPEHSASGTPISHPVPGRLRRRASTFRMRWSVDGFALNCPTPIVQSDHARKTPKDRFYFRVCIWLANMSGLDHELGLRSFQVVPDAEESEEENLKRVKHKSTSNPSRSTDPNPALPVGGGVFRVGFAATGTCIPWVIERKPRCATVSNATGSEIEYVVLLQVHMREHARGASDVT